MPGKGDQILAYPDYWDGLYSESDGDTPTHEWYRSFSDLESFLQDNLFARPGLRAEDNPLILHLGSGDSVIPVELASRNYHRQLCVDFSPVVVRLMTERHSQIDGIEWKLQDVRNMVDISDKSIDVAFDKGTLDAMVHGSPWSPPDEVRENTRKYLKEAHRVLKDDGEFLHVSFRQPHFMEPLLKQDNMWDFNMKVLGESGMFDYYGFVMRKRLEISQKPLQ